MTKRTKNAAAVELAKLRAKKLSPERRKEISEMGAAIGGKVRAERLTPERRREIAKRAAEKRWGKKADSKSRGKKPKS